MNPEKHIPQDWGRLLGDKGTPFTREDMALHVQMLIADRLTETCLKLDDIQTRLLRIELWMEHNVPGYQPADHRKYLDIALKRDSNGSIQDEHLRRLESPTAALAPRSTKAGG